MCIACVALNFLQASCVTCITWVAFRWKPLRTSNEVGGVAARDRTDYQALVVALTSTRVVIQPVCGHAVHIFAVMAYV